jgi:hypothetical protein
VRFLISFKNAVSVGKVAVSTQNQALCALIFLYRDLLCTWQDISFMHWHASTRKRRESVLLPRAIERYAWLQAQDKRRTAFTGSLRI